MFLSFRNFFYSNPSWDIFPPPFPWAPKNCIFCPSKTQQYFISESRGCFCSANSSAFQKQITFCSFPGSWTEELLKHQKFFLLSGLLDHMESMVSPASPGVFSPLCLNCLWPSLKPLLLPWNLIPVSRSVKQLLAQRAGRWGNARRAQGTTFTLAGRVPILQQLEMLVMRSVPTSLGEFSLQNSRKFCWARANWFFKCF